jgi:hypothetical protein
LLARRLAGGSVVPNLGGAVNNHDVHDRAAFAGASQVLHPGGPTMNGAASGRLDDDVMQLFQANFGTDPFGGGAAPTGPFSQPLSIQSLQSTPHAQQQQQQQRHHQQQQQQQQHHHHQQLQMINSMLNMGSSSAGLAHEYLPVTLDGSALLDVGFWSQPSGQANHMGPHSISAAGVGAPSPWSGESAVTMPATNSLYGGFPASSASLSVSSASTVVASSAAAAAAAAASASPALGSSGSTNPTNGMVLSSNTIKGSQSNGADIGPDRAYNSAVVDGAMSFNDQVAAPVSPSGDFSKGNKTEIAIRMMDPSLASAVYRLTTQGKVSIMDALALIAHHHLVEDRSSNLPPLESMLLLWARSTLATPPLPPNAIYQAARQLCSQLGVTLVSKAGNSRSTISTSI